MLPTQSSRSVVSHSTLKKPRRPFVGCRKFAIQTATSWLSISANSNEQAERISKESRKSGICSAVCSCVPAFLRYVGARRQEYTTGGAGDHRQRRRVSYAAVYGVWDKRGCWSFDGKRRPHVRCQGAGIRHG